MDLHEAVGDSCGSAGLRSTRRVTPEGNTEGFAFSETQEFQDPPGKAGDPTPASVGMTLHFLFVLVQKILLARLKMLKIVIPKKSPPPEIRPCARVRPPDGFTTTFGPKA